MKYFILIMLGLILFLNSICQSAFVEKSVSNGKSRLGIGIKSSDSIKIYYANCFFKNVTLLPDTTKIRLIGELLNFMSDTSMCYSPVFNLCSNYTITKQEPVNKEYNLQIDGLILINYIAFSSNACYYSPYPLLYDKDTKKEICCNAEVLNVVIEIYKKWFKGLKRKGLIDYCYPLANKRYEWFASKFKQRKFKSSPHWNKNFDCKELE